MRTGSPVKDTVVGDTTSAAEPEAVTFNVTVIVCGLFDVPGTEMVIVPLYVAAVRVLGVTLMRRAVFPVPRVPAAGATWSHAVALDTAVKLSEPELRETLPPVGLGFVKPL